MLLNVCYYCIKTWTRLTHRRVRIDDEGEGAVQPASPSASLSASSSAFPSEDDVDYGKQKETANNDRQPRRPVQGVEEAVPGKILCLAIC